MKNLITSLKAILTKLGGQTESNNLVDVIDSIADNLDNGDDNNNAKMLNVDLTGTPVEDTNTIPAKLLAIMPIDQGYQYSLSSTTMEELDNALNNNMIIYYKYFTDHGIIYDIATHVGKFYEDEIYTYGINMSNLYGIEHELYVIDDVSPVGPGR